MAFEINNNTGDRRPIATRETRLAKRAATYLVQLGFSPNGISIAGMIAGIAAGAAFALTKHFDMAERWFWFAGAVLVQCRLLANMFDGMVAIESGKTSLVGELYNEVPDRISDMGILIGFGYSLGTSPTLGYMAATLAILVAYIRAEGKVAGGEQEFCGPMAKPQRMFLITLAALLNIFLPIAYRSANLRGQEMTLNNVFLIIIVTGCLITAVRRLKRVSNTLKGIL